MTGIQGQQCIWNNCDVDPSSSAISWGTSYDWLGGPSGQVESYTAAILGWHYSDVDPASGLPLQISSNRKVDCTWSFRVKNDPEHAAIQNISYDLWVSESATPDSQTRPTDEIMIWLSHDLAGPIGGAPRDLADVGGSSWNLSIGRNSTWNVYSFVRAVNTPCETLDLMDFFRYLVDHYQFDASKYLIGIEAGSEVFSARGELDVDRYSCDIQ